MKAIISVIIFLLLCSVVVAETKSYLYPTANVGYDIPEEWDDKRIDFGHMFTPPGDKDKIEDGLYVGSSIIFRVEEGDPLEKPLTPEYAQQFASWVIAAREEDEEFSASQVRSSVISISGIPAIRIDFLSSWSHFQGEETLIGVFDGDRFHIIQYTGQRGQTESLQVFEHFVDTYRVFTPHFVAPPVVAEEPVASQRSQPNIKTEESPWWIVLFITLLGFASYYIIYFIFMPLKEVPWKKSQKPNIMTAKQKLTKKHLNKFALGSVLIFAPSLMLILIVIFMQNNGVPAILASGNRPSLFFYLVLILFIISTLTGALMCFIQFYKLAKLKYQFNPNEPPRRM